MKNWIKSFKNLIVQQKSTIETGEYRYFYAHENDTSLMSGLFKSRLHNYTEHGQ